MGVIIFQKGERNPGGRAGNVIRKRAWQWKMGPGRRRHLPGGWPLTIILTVIAAAGLFYRWLPALNLKSSEFWGFLFAVSMVFVFLAFMTGSIKGQEKKQEPVFRRPLERGPYAGGEDLTGSGPDLTGPEKSDSQGAGRGRKGIQPGWLFFLPVFFFLFPMAAGFLTGSPILHARAYSRILTVQEGDTDSIPSVQGTSSIALMDTASAQMLGNREIGSLSSVVSQYDVSEYTQIDSQGAPVKVSPLRYAGFFKWYRNRANGIPGYVVVDPVSMDARYVALDSGMKYVPSAWFGENLMRRLRFAYPAAMLSNLHFEIDEEGRPWYVVSVIDHKVGLFDGTQVIGAIIVDPVTGQSQRFAVGGVPRWVDVVFEGNLICQQYNYYAQLHDGYLNSVFGQTGCRKVTEYVGEGDQYVPDFGYVAKDGDIWIYTGVTSLNSDSSNIGFIMSNERTEETIFIPCAGADEFSAMSAAQGEVQEKRYAASFPSLILVDEEPAYIMVLKDASGLVKMYAAVNVHQYNTVATASTQEACIDKYRALMAGDITQAQATAEDGDGAVENGTGTGLSPADDSEANWQEAAGSAVQEKEIVIKRLQTIDRNGNTYLYVVDQDRQIYHARYEDVIGMLLVSEGDTIKIRTDGEHFVLLPEEVSD